MCTISWRSVGPEVSVFFNRDESVARVPAEPPAARTGGHRLFLAPRDPAGGGTWLAVNDAGVVIALLNHYGSRVPASGTISRGTIAWELAAAADLHAAWFNLTKHLADFSPFHLLVIRRHDVRVETWTGRDHFTHHETPDAGMLTTSSSPDPAVVPLRRLAWSRMLEVRSPPTDADLAAYHDGGWGMRDPASSALMDRGDRRTVSQSRITITADRIHHRYRTRSGVGTAPGPWMTCGLATAQARR